MPGVVRSYEMKARSPNVEWTLQRSLCRIQSSVKNGKNSTSWTQQRSSDTSWEWHRKTEGFREHIAIDGSLNGYSGRDAACGWAVAQLDHNKAEEPWKTIL